MKPMSADVGEAAPHDHPLGVPHAGRERTHFVPALLITAAFMVVEIVGGLATGSLALLADAGHMATDSGALLLALAAAWLARRPATPSRSFGLFRAEVVAALANGAALIAASAVLMAEAVERLLDPRPVQSGPMLAIAIVGLLANTAVAWVLTRGGDHAHDLNTRGALLHVAGDMLGSVAAIAAALIIRGTGWMGADPLLSALTGALVVLSAWRLLREALDVLLEAAPASLDVDALRRDMTGEAGVAAVHDLHVWSLASGVLALSAHVELSPGAGWERVLPRLAHLLQHHHGIAHLTLQPEEARGGPSAFRGCTLHAGPRAAACIAPAVAGLPARGACGGHAHGARSGAGAHRHP